MIVICIILLLFILLFMYCALKVASISDEVGENHENS